MKIEFLYFEGCPHADIAYSRLEEVVANLSTGTLIEKVSVTSEEAVAVYGFCGSPSIRIDGLDLEHCEFIQPSMSCRLYEGEGAPQKWLIEAAVLRALRPRGILFLCVANSARSQIGEGIARMLAQPDVHVQSAGSKPSNIRPEAIRVMSELGIDSSRQKSKNVEDISPETVDTVITLCGEEECPLFLGSARRLHWGLPDPVALGGNEETRLEAFRMVREELLKRLSVVFYRSSAVPESINMENR